MRILKVTLITFVVYLVGILLLSCASESGSPPLTENQVVTAQRGNLTIDITAVGNLELSLKEDLAFEISGYVEEVLVEEGDTVEEGQVLASLDTTSLGQAVKTAERAVRTAEIDLEKATDNYRKITYPYTYRTFVFDVPSALALIGDAQRELDEAVEIMQEFGLSQEPYNWEQYGDAWRNLRDAQDNLVKARENLKRGYGSDVFGSEILPMKDYWTLRTAQLDMEKAQVALDKAEDTLDIAKDELEKAVIVAPFAGFITKVNVDGGEEVKKGTVAVQLADPDKFEAEVTVNEMDIFQVKLGRTAWVQVDAMPVISLPAKVTHISPTATIQSGVVNYKVKVEIESLEAVMQEWQEAMEEVPSGELSERLQQAIEEGSITQEQAEEMMRQRQQGQGGQQGQMPTMIPEDFQLREGLTVIVSIIVEERNDVLMVPNAAISRQGQETYVQVLKDGVVEERSIKTGISNWQYTEVISGLSEGEKMVIPETTATPTTPAPGGRVPFFPGGGRPH